MTEFEITIAVVPAFTLLMVEEKKGGSFVTPQQRQVLERIFGTLDEAGTELLRDAMNSAPDIREARQAVNNVRNTINGILDRA